MGQDLNAAGTLYPARVMHRRLIAPFYRFVYRLFYLLMDIDRIAEAARGFGLFSSKSFKLFSFPLGPSKGSGAPPDASR